MSNFSLGAGIPALILGIFFLLYGLFYMGIVNKTPSIGMAIGGIVFIIVGGIVLNIK